jgi:hypothetical protein
MDLLGDGKRHKMQATVTTDHPESHYGLPVVVIEDGKALDFGSWMLLDYQVVSADVQELDGLKRWLGLMSMAAGVPDVSQTVGGRPPKYDAPMVKTGIYLRLDQKKWLAARPDKASETIRSLIDAAMMVDKAHKKE